MSKDDVRERLGDEVARVLAMGLLPEHRELLADALVTRLPPHLRELESTFTALLEEIEQEFGAQERSDWAHTVAQDLTGHDTPTDWEQMSADQRERWFERRLKYGPDV